MKKRKNIETILVGIDYTKSSDNALEYAIMMAAKSDASIMLFHMYETPVVHTFSGAYFISFTELQAYNQGKLEKYKANLLKKHPRVSIETFATYKTVKAGVDDLIKSRKIHYVVLGLESKTKFSKFLYGTTGLDIAGKISCPVIIVPENYKEHKLKHAILAVDNRKSVSAKLMKKVQKFNKHFGLQKELVHFKTADEFLFQDSKKTRAIDKKTHAKVVECDNFETGILNYAKSNKVDLIGIVSHSHSLMYNLFNESNTKVLAFKSKVPVMSLHE